MTEQRRYSDFDLLIEGSEGEGYRARVLDSPVGKAAGSFALPFSDLQNDAVNLNISVLGADGSVSEEADEDDHQLTLSPLDPAAAIAESAHYIVGGRTVSIAFADVIAIPGADAGYVLEARIRWSEIGVFDPQPGEQFGLLLTVFDNDGEQVDGETLQSEIKANVAADGGPLDSTFFRSPRSWGTPTLEG